jgi:hypothetical protein
MYVFLKRYKIVIIVMLVDLFLFWLLNYSGVIVPFISPSIEQYQNSGTSFPRNFNQIFIWVVLHFPTSIVLGNLSQSITGSEVLTSISVIQTGLIAYFFEKRFRRKKEAENN